MMTTARGKKTLQTNQKRFTQTQKTNRVVNQSLGNENIPIGKISTTESSDFFLHNRTDKAVNGAEKSLPSTFSNESNRLKFDLTSSSNSKAKTL
jgi:hypothetical protein